MKEVIKKQTRKLKETAQELTIELFTPEGPALTTEIYTSLYTCTL